METGGALWPRQRRPEGRASGSLGDHRRRPPVAQVRLCTPGDAEVGNRMSGDTKQTPGAPRQHRRVMRGPGSFIRPFSWVEPGSDARQYLLGGARWAVTKLWGIESRRARLDELTARGNERGVWQPVQRGPGAVSCS